MTDTRLILANGRILGRVISNVYILHMRSSRHFLPDPPSIVFDQKGLMLAAQYGAEYVAVVDDDRAKSYCARIARIWLDGLRADRRYGVKRIALPLDKFYPTIEEVRAVHPTIV